MCGRFERHSSLVDFSNVIGNLNQVCSDELPASFNIAPSQQALVVRESVGSPIAVAMKWGLRPSWLKASNATPQINARSETACEKPMFRNAIRQHRCLILCDGYFEWQKRSSNFKQPYYIHGSSHTPFVLAGIWSTSKNLTGEEVSSFVILTTRSDESVSHIHHRMPLRVETDIQAAWLNPQITEAKDIQQLISACKGLWKSYPIGLYVNNPKNSTRRCISRDNTG